MVRSKDYSAERLADRAQIQDTIYRWCRAVDRLDLDAVRDLFHTDATDSHGAYVGGVDGLINWIRERHKTIPFCMHAVNNILIEFVSADAAVVETYVFSAQHYPASGDKPAQIPGGGAKPGIAMDMLAYCRYVDRFERRDSVWRIQKRVCVFDWHMFYEAHHQAPSMGPPFTVGRRDMSDFVYETRAAAGLKD